MRTCCVHKLFFVFVLTFRTTYVNNMFYPCSPPCSPHVLSLEFSCTELVNSTDNVLSYCGLVNARISTSEIDLPVSSINWIKSILYYPFHPSFVTITPTPKCTAFQTSRTTASCVCIKCFWEARKIQKSHWRNNHNPFGKYNIIIRFFFQFLMIRKVLSHFLVQYDCIAVPWYFQ